jgi:dTDP-L-rhamnose 4-epimerase
MTSVLVTGGAGFVGSHIVDEYIKKGYDVTVIDNLTDQVHHDEPTYLNDDAEYVWGDIRDRELMTDLLEAADVLNHQASVVGVGQSMYEVERYVEVNTLGTARLLDIIVDEKIELKKMVIASSMSIYGEGEYYCPGCNLIRHPSLRDDEQMADSDWEHSCSECGQTLEPRATPESKPRDSTSIYAITKKDQEDMMLSIGKTYNIPTIALRYFNIFGSRQSLDNPYTGVCAIFSSRIKNNSPPLVFEDGEQIRDFVHVSDVARANLLATESDAAGVAINIGTGTPTSINEIAEELINLYGKSNKLSPKIANEYRQGDIRHCYADPNMAADEIGFEAEISLEEGMSELVEWGKKQEAEDHFEEAHEELQNRDLVGNN